MVIQTTRWASDTCDCIIDYNWDNSLPQDQVTHTLNTIVRSCPFHAVHTDDNVKFNSMKEENTRKNISHQHILDNAPPALFDIDATNGFRVLKPGINLTWTWSGTSPNRVLNLSYNGISLTNAQKTLVQSVLNTKFGIGKVILV